MGAQGDEKRARNDPWGTVTSEINKGKLLRWKLKGLENQENVI